MGRVTDFNQLLTDTFTGPTHYDSGPLKLAGASENGLIASMVARVLDGRVKAVAGLVTVRLATRSIACSAHQARAIAKAMGEAADALDAAATRKDAR